MMRTLKICFTSDVHGYFYPTTYGDMNQKEMGLFACADSFKKDENTLILDGGDMLQGSAFAYYCKQVLKTPERIAEMVNDCGYDYYTLGNHDFNYGMDYQEVYRNNHKGRCLCENVTDEEGKTLFPCVLHTMSNGLRVGLVGIVTDYVNVWEKEENLAGVRITDPFEAARMALSKLKEKADVTICIYHGGFECDLATGERLSNTTENVGYRICKELDFDILLTGHQHMSVDGQEIYGTYVVQPLDNAKEYHYLKVSVEDERKVICSEKRTANPLLGNALKTKYRETEEEVQHWLNDPVGHINKELLPEEKARMALFGSPIADFLNRVQLYFSGADISAVGLANEIVGFHKKVSTRDIIATYPYPNTLVVCEITGAQLKTAMERSAEYFEMTADGNVAVAESFLTPKVEHYNYDYYSGISYEINPANPVGNRIVRLERNGKPVKEEDTFTLCLNNYRYSGAGGYEVYRDCPSVKEINIEMVELIMDYFRTHPLIEM